MRRMTTAGVLIAIALLSSPVPGFGQACLHRAGETAAERQRRLDALTAIRFLTNAEETARRGGRGYRPLSELSTLLAPHRSDGGQMGETARRMRFDRDEILPGWMAKLQAGEDSYLLMLRDTNDPCGFAYVSAEDGVVLEARPVASSASLLTQ